MGRQIVRKRRRVFSLEPNKLVYITFARNYAKNLMASLSKISSNHHHQNLQKVVRFEVDMAMALSASEFSWGHALKKKLLQTEENSGDDDNNCFDFSLQMAKFSRENYLEREKAGEEGEEEKKKMENGLVKLRRILPGGDNNNNNNGDLLLEEDDLLKQTESYIKCLELQVNVLRCLVDTNTN